MEGQERNLRQTMFISVSRMKKENPLEHISKRKENLCPEQFSSAACSTDCGKAGLAEGMIFTAILGTGRKMDAKTLLQGRSGSCLGLPCSGPPVTMEPGGPPAGKLDCSLSKSPVGPNCQHQALWPPPSAGLNLPGKATIKPFRYPLAQPCSHLLKSQGILPWPATEAWDHMLKQPLNHIIPSSYLSTASKRNPQ